MGDAPADARLEQLERRVRNDPMSVAFAALAEEYRRAGRLEEAIEACRAGLTRHPAYLSARVTLGRALMETGALEEAEAELQRVVEAAPENLAAGRCLAELHRQRGDRAATEEHDRPAPAAPPAQAVQSPPPPAGPPPAPEPPAAAEPAEPAPERAEVVPEALAAPEGAEIASPSEDPVIADLEEFLTSIVAARQARDDERGWP